MQAPVEMEMRPRPTAGNGARPDCAPAKRASKRCYFTMRESEAKCGGPISCHSVRCFLWQALNVPREDIVSPQTTQVAAVGVDSIDEVLAFPIRHKRDRFRVYPGD